MFDKFDTQKKEELNREEIGTILGALFKKNGTDVEVTEKDVDRFIDDYDHDNDGKISWFDFNSGENGRKFFNEQVTP